MAARNPLVSTDGVGTHDTEGNQPLAADWSQHLGWFKFFFDNDRWTWSPQVERMHGYRPRTTAPSTLLVLSHVHLDDFHDVAAALQDARRTPKPFSSRHRILDTSHRVHQVAMIGAPFFDSEGAVAGLQGFCVDLAEARDGHSLALNDGHVPYRRQRVRTATQC